MGYGKINICLKCKHYGRYMSESDIEHEFCTKGVYGGSMVAELFTTPKITKCTFYQKKVKK